MNRGEINDEDFTIPLLQFQFGNNAECVKFDFNADSVYAIVFKEIANELGEAFSLYWIEKGLPETFRLSGKNIIAISQDHIVAFEKIRWLFNPEFRGDVVTESSKYIIYKTTAELALKYGSVDSAVLLFVMSMMNNSFRRPDMPSLLNIKPTSEKYTPIWFYSLLHELGHEENYQSQYNIVDDDNFYSDSSILSCINDVFDKSLYTDSVRHEVLKKLSEKDVLSVISIANLKKEIIADIFAADWHFTTGHELSRRNDGGKYDLGSALYEFGMYHFIIGLIEQCKACARATSPGKSEYDKMLEMEFHSISIRVRRFIVWFWLTRGIPNIFYNNKQSETQNESILTLLNDVQLQLNNEYFVPISNALGIVKDFCLHPDKAANEILEEFRSYKINNVILELEADQFIKKAEALQRKSELLETFKSIVNYRT